ncbi:MAG: O-methyltransferase [Bacteroidia bacterium]|nr:MAG: O-methyltransferase [Bacteroidia bacterium]
MCPKNKKVVPITITNPVIEDYCYEHASDLPIELYEIEQYTKENILAHRMLSNHIQAHFLIALSKMIKPKRVLEIGTFTGYSAICLAHGLKEGGKIITIEKKAEFAEIARHFFNKYGYENIQVIEGNAIEVIGQLQQTFDLIYLDADKENYTDYYKKLLPLLSENGWMAIDNTLWKGLVSDLPREPVTKKMQEFNDYVAKQKNIFSFILPVRDGITLIQKL